MTKSRRNRLSQAPRYARNWRYFLAAGGCAMVAIATIVAARLWWGGDEATAQNPSARPPAQGASGARQQIPLPVSRATAAKPKVVAIVNGESISREQLAKETVRRYGKEVVENLVNKHLILQECQKQHIEITADEVEAEISRMAGKFGLSSDRWLEMLKSERNINPQQYRNDIIWPTIALRKLAADRLQIGREELLQEWESQYGEKRQVRMIMMKDKARCEQVRQYVAAKPDEFGKVAKDYSENATSAAARGLIPPVRKHVGDAHVEQAVFALAEDEISPVVAAAGDYYIFKCEKVIPAQRYDAKTQAQMETAIRNQLADKKLRNAGAELFKKLQANAQVVNVYNNVQLRQQMPGVAATINGQQLTMQALKEACVTRHGVDVLEGEINRVLLTQQLQKAGAAVTDADINEEVAQAALMYGFRKPDGRADVDGWLKKVLSEDDATLELYVQDAVWPSVALKKLVSGTVEVTQEDLKKGYEANYGDQVEVLVCVLGSQRRAQEVWEQAKATPNEKFFGDLAYQYSIEPTSKYNFGKVPPIRHYSGQPNIEKEAFRLKPGELSEIVALVGEKYVVMRCVKQIKAENPPEFGAVKDELYKDIYEKKLRIAMSERFEEIRKFAQIDNLLAGTRQSGGRPAKNGVRPASAVQPVAIPGMAPRGAVRPADGGR